MMRSLIIEGNPLSPAARAHTGLPAVKVVGRTLDGRMVAVREDLRMAEASMALFPGSLVPPEAERIHVPQEAIEPIMLKLAQEERFENELSWERKMLAELAGVRGFPRVIDHGRMVVTEIGHSPTPQPRSVPYLVMPLIEGASLKLFTIEKWEEKPPKRRDLSLLTERILPGLAERLAYLHAKKIVHRDVKPDNVLFDNKAGVTLLDFGRANRLDGSPRRETGALGFYPPELLLQKPKEEDVRADVYGLGITAFVMLTGESGLLYQGMEAPWQYTGMISRSFREKVIRRYYQSIMGLRSATTGEIVKLCNMPKQLKQTPLGNYLASLFHPAVEQRPADMNQIGQQLRQLGGQFSSHEINLKRDSG